MSACNRLRDLIALYAAGDLDEKYRARVERHLQQCAECRAAAAQMTALVGAAARERVSPPAELADRIMRQFARQLVPAPRPSHRWLALSYAAGLVAVFGVGIFVGLQLPGATLRGRLNPIAQAPPPAPPALVGAVREPPNSLPPPSPAHVGAVREPPNGPQPTLTHRPDGARFGPRHIRVRNQPAEPMTAPPEAGAPAPGESPSPELPQRREIAALSPAGLDDARLVTAPPGELE